LETLRVANMFLWQLANRHANQNVVEILSATRLFLWLPVNTAQTIFDALDI
jgi:hypothetical protein